MDSTIERSNENGLLITTFLIHDALFGIDANLVQEVVQVKKLTIVHHAPQYVKGVMNLRGQVVTIIDLGEKLDLGQVTENEKNRILIVQWKQEYIGVLVENVTEVIQIENEMIKPPPGNVHGVQNIFISGVFKNKNGNLAGLLDLDKIFELESNNLES